MKLGQKLLFIMSNVGTKFEDQISQDGQTLAIFKEIDVLFIKQ